MNVCDCYQMIVFVSAVLTYGMESNVRNTYLRVNAFVLKRISTISL